MSEAPAPDFGHLLHMTDSNGTFEHAELTEPRREHGYCTDDMARVLVVASREPEPDPAVRQLVIRSLRFLGSAQALDGRFRNRLDQRGKWLDGPSVDDCWGRSIWGLGTAATRSDSEVVRQTATSMFERSAVLRSPHLRSTAFAALGAADLLGARPGHRGARDLLLASADRMVEVTAPTGGWAWPEDRLAYANAVVPEAMIAVGAALGRRGLLDRGLTLLGWLLEHESHDGHLSVTPVGGAGPDDRHPAFGQQPIEVAALADACARASAVDRDERWPAGMASAAAWFAGANDGGHVMWDPTSGGGFDGLEADGPNRNQGTESTLALLSTQQHGRRLVAA